MHPFSEIRQARTHLLQAETDQALRLLERRLQTVDRELQQEVMLLMGRFRKWQSEQNVGLKPEEVVWLQINQGLLNICQHWEELELERFWTNKQPFYTVPAITGSYEEEKWKVVETPGRVTLENHHFPDAIKYHWVELEGMDTKTLPLSVEVKVEGAAPDGPVSALGLLLNMPEGGLPYLVYCVDQHHCLRLFQRDASGLKTLLQFPKMPAGDNDSHLLQAFRLSDTLYLFHNGRPLEQVSVEVPHEGLPGIWAWGAGQFHFQDLSFYR